MNYGNRGCELRLDYVINFHLPEYMPTRFVFHLYRPLNMDTVTAQKKPTLPKDAVRSSEEDESDFYTDQEDSFQDKYTSEASQLEGSNPNSITTSETESIEREAPAQDDRHAPTTEVIRRKTSTALPANRGIAPIQPITEITERNGLGQAIVKDAGTALSLRLDLNLDIEVELKAKIRGDLTLSLLLVPHYHYHTLGSMKLILCRA